MIRYYSVITINIIIFISQEETIGRINKLKSTREVLSGRGELSNSLRKSTKVSSN